MPSFYATLLAHFLALLLLTLFLLLFIVVPTLSRKPRLELIDPAINTGAISVRTIGSDMARLIATVAYNLSFALRAGVVTFVVVVARAVAFVVVCAPFIVIVIFWFGTTVLFVLFPVTVFLIFIKFISKVRSTVVIAVIVVSKRGISIRLRIVTAAVGSVLVGVGIRVIVIVIVELLSEFIDVIIAAWSYANLNVSSL